MLVLRGCRVPGKRQQLSSGELRRFFEIRLSWTLPSPELFWRSNGDRVSKDGPSTLVSESQSEDLSFDKRFSFDPECIRSFAPRRF